MIGGIELDIGSPLCYGEAPPGVKLVVLDGARTGLELMLGCD